MSSKEAIKKASARQTRKVKVFRQMGSALGFNLRPTWIRKEYLEALKRCCDESRHFNVDTILDEALAYWFRSTSEGKALCPKIGQSSDIKKFVTLAKHQLAEEDERNAALEREKERSALDNDR